MKWVKKRTHNQQQDAQNQKGFTLRDCAETTHKTGLGIMGQSQPGHCGAISNQQTQMHARITLMSRNKLEIDLIKT